MNKNDVTEMNGPHIYVRKVSGKLLISRAEIHTRHINISLHGKNFFLTTIHIFIPRIECNLFIYFVLHQNIFLAVR